MHDNILVLSKNSKQQISLLYLFELLGKPILFLFTFLVIVVLTITKLLKHFTQKIFRQLKFFPDPTSSHLSPPPHPLLTLPYQTPFSKQLSLFPSAPHLFFPPLFLSFLAACILLFAYIFYLQIFKDLPDPHLLSTSLPSLSTKIYDRHGQLLYQIYRDENRTLIKLSDLPPHLIHATIASEDRSFYSHPGISLTGIARALYENTKCFTLHASCTTLQGGSTITQQLVKNAFLSPEKTLQRKLKEVVLALWTETIYSKDEILEFYFNYVPYGGTAYGIEEASQYYFGHSATSLNLSEAALLAGLPIAPTTFSPFSSHPYLAKIRQHQVLNKMANYGYLTEPELLQALSDSLSFRPPRTNIHAPHFVMYVQELLVERFGEDMVYRGGLEVVTSLDLQLQQMLETNIANELAKLQALRVGNGAGLILDPSSGEILAMVGSKNFFDPTNDGQVNLTLQARQPGSSIKPLTYTLAFMNGFTPASQINDSPICFTSPGSPPYCPKNYDNRFHGSLTLRTALASSYNIPAIKLLNTLGVENLVELGRSLGITTWNDSSRYGLALTLGGGEITMLELSSAYAAFANGGYYLAPHAILSVRNHATLPLHPQPAPKQVIPSNVAYQITSILSDNQARSPAFGLHSVLNVKGHEVAVKTGTSNDLRDNWTIGYTTNYLVATWVGNNDNTPMSSVASGITGASPIWQQTILTLLQDSPPHRFTVPSNLVQLNLSCTSPPRYEYFIPGTEPKNPCSPPAQEGQIL